MRFTETIVSIEDRDPHKWPKSKWRCLKAYSFWFQQVISRQILLLPCIAETRGGNHCCNSAVGKKNRGNWKKGQSPPLLLEVGIYGGSPELCTSPRTNAGGLESHVRCCCRLSCSVLPDAITSGMEVGALNFAAILLVHCCRRSLLAIDDEGRKMMK
nr:auxin response factor 2-like isoform X1 [Ipomoea batatas]